MRTTPLETFYIASTAVSIATLDIVGKEGLLVIENPSAGPRTLRVELVLDR